jgi:hypothetical protein
VARFAVALRDGLDDDVIVWYEPLFDVGGERPDLVLLLPNLGLLTLEVIESRAGAVRSVGNDGIVIFDGTVEGPVPNPLAKAESFAVELGRRICREDRLGSADRLSAKAGAVFPYLSRAAAVDRGLESVLRGESCLYRDDLDVAVSSPAEFRRRISSLHGGTIRDPLPEPVEKIYRALIHPDTVIGSQRLPFPTVDTGEDDLLVLDRKQEALAKSLGVGHRVIRGVAGSGKTLVLTYRARLLAESFPRQGVLVTCFTNSLAGRLSRQLSPWRNITVATLDSLMYRARRDAGMQADYQTAGRTELAEMALRALESGPDRAPHFHHVLIDEAQDFPTEALQFAVHLLVEGSDSLLAVADPVQNIFGTKFTWKAAGINAAGRTRWLDQSYRNTREILEFAHNFVVGGGAYTVDSDPDPDDETTISRPTFSARSGPLPVVLSADSRSAEVVNMALYCRTLLERGIHPGEIALLYGATNTGGFDWPGSIVSFFAREGLPLQWASNPADRNLRSRIGQDEDKIVLCTIHSAKGLEFRNVILCGYLDDQPPEQSRISRSLIYVGMTRATHELALSASGKHPYLVDLDRS